MADIRSLDAKQTALVLIDLRKGILDRQTAPHSASEVLARSARLVERFQGASTEEILKSLV